MLPALALGAAFGLLCFLTKKPKHAMGLVLPDEQVSGKRPRKAKSGGGYAYWQGGTIPDHAITPAVLRQLERGGLVEAVGKTPDGKVTIYALTHAGRVLFGNGKIGADSPGRIVGKNKITGQPITAAQLAADWRAAFQRSL